MSLNFLEELKKAPPKKRAKLLHEMYQKNIGFFMKRNQFLGRFIQEAGTGGYNIDINDEFLSVIHLESGQLCHPKNGLERYVKELGSPHHTGWIDKLKILPVNRANTEHDKKIEEFLIAMHSAMPMLTPRISLGEVSLPKLQNKKRFSGMTIFLGTFLGFHIAHYLQNTEINDAVIIEPDLYKFVLSCWFLDFQAIEKRLAHKKGLILHVGSDMPTTPEEMIDSTGITSSAWLRILPAYPSTIFDDIIHRLDLRWRELSEIFVPFDREVRNLSYGLKNLQLKRPINYLPVALSDNSRIAIVASGPSLDNDMEWLKINQDKIIIFAAHSAVKSLRRNGIKPDFQCSLDTELDTSLLDRLELDPDVPFISYYKANPESLKRFKTVLLVNEAGKANPVKFKKSLHNTHPTTGNLTTSVVSYMKPKRLFLLGLDLGTKNVFQDHVSGYWAEDNSINATPKQLLLSKAELAEQGFIPVPSNFVESEGLIYTHAYHNNARKAIEAQLFEIKEQTEIFNLSDGSKISHTTPLRSQEAILSIYPEKKKDIDNIIASFVSDNTIWQPYIHDMNKILSVINSAVESAMEMKKFDWNIFYNSLNNTFPHVLAEGRKLEAGDLRVEVYHKLITDLLTEWYRIIVFTRTQKESELAYKLGLKHILIILSSLYIPHAEITE